MRRNPRVSSIRFNGYSILAALLLSACGEADVSPTLSIEQIETAVAQTLEAEAIEEVAATAAPSHTQTPTPTVPVIETETPTPITTLTPSTTPSPSVTLPPVSAVSCVPQGTVRETGRVIAITDGDTIRVEINGLSYSVRYIGMDTPETGQEYSLEATTKNSALVSGKTVTLVKDVSETDRFDRLLRYIFVGDLFVNYQLVREGFAFVATFPPDVACTETFLEAERLARSDGEGLWAPTPIPVATQPSGNCHPSYPDVCIPIGSADYDCAGGSGNGPNYIQGPIRVRHDVPDPDPHDLDRNKDGVGCESG